MQKLRTFSAIIIAFALFYSILQVIPLSREKEVLQTDYVALHHVNQGMLSPRVWKDKLSDIVYAKLESFQLTSGNQKQMRQSITSVLEKMVAEMEELFEQKKNNDDWVISAGAKLFQELVFDADDLRAKVPEFTDLIIQELDKKENRKKFKAFLQKEIEANIHTNDAQRDAFITSLLETYKAQNVTACSTSIKKTLGSIQASIRTYSWTVFALTIILFLICLFKNTNKNFLQYAVLVLVCAGLLVAGLLMPMLSIDARISHFSFGLMGETVVFDNQILFYQSKSILEVIRILLQTGEAQSLLVGALLLLFSVCFPFSKLVSSLILVKKPNLLKNKLLYFLAFKSSKWSMADVMVVAIFMTYISFKGVVTNQLGKLESASSSIEILTTDYSAFGDGFLFFLTFCLGSLFLAASIERKVTASNNTL